MAKTGWEVSTRRQGGRLSGRRPPRLPKARPLGAITGQMSQALGSFVLQIVAARALGAEGLGLFALVLSVLVMVTAVSSGLIGDTLTILDRHQAPVRAGIQRWACITAVVSGVTATAASALTHTLDLTSSVIFGLALVAFLVEDALRRLLMASMRFWSLVIVDATAFVVYLGTLGIGSLSGGLSIRSFLIALVLGQAVAALVALPLLPRRERHLAPWRPAVMGVVARFGFWRSAQQSIRPTMLTVARVLITLAVGRAAFGELEAARVYMAPAMLVVQGAGSYLISSYAHQKLAPIATMVSRADRASTLMLAAALVVGVVTTLVVPVLGPLITGGSYELAPLTVFGWAVYAASAAAVMPFASLAAVRGRQPLVVGLRGADSVVSLACLVLVLYPLHAQVGWTPYALAVGSFVGGLVIRSMVLKPLLRERNP